MSYTVVVEFMDGTAVPITDIEVDAAIRMFHKYVSDAKLHGSDGPAYTAQRISVCNEDGRIIDVWERDDGSDGLPDRVIVQNDAEILA